MAKLKQILVYCTTRVRGLTAVVDLQYTTIYARKKH